MTVMKLIMPTTVPIADRGSSTVPLTTPFVPGQQSTRERFGQAAVRCVGKIIPQPQSPDLQIIATFFSQHVFVVPSAEGAE